jgi:hypothetical protein
MSGQAPSQALSASLFALAFAALGTACAGNPSVPAQTPVGTAPNAAEVTQAQMPAATGHSSCGAKGDGGCGAKKAPAPMVVVAAVAEGKTEAMPAPSAAPMAALPVASEVKKVPTKTGPKKVAGAQESSCGSGSCSAKK